jgi:hypothetical protein
VNRLALLVIAACSGTPKHRPSQAPRAFAGGHTRADVYIFLSPEERVAVRANIDSEPGRGMHVRLEILSGPVEWLCDGTRAWTVYPRGCSVESSCDEAVRHWFDIGWGYAKLTRFIAGERPDTPGWVVEHHGLRKYPTPTKSTIQVMHHPFPGVFVSWGEWVPTTFDLAAAIARAKALPSCAAFSPPLRPSPTTPVKP